MSQSISSLWDFLEVSLVSWDVFIPYSVCSCFSLAIGELDSPFSRRVGAPTRFLTNGRFQRFGRCVLFILILVYNVYPVVETGFQSFPAFVAGFSLWGKLCSALFSSQVFPDLIFSKPLTASKLQRSLSQHVTSMSLQIVILKGFNLDNSFALRLQRVFRMSAGCLPFCEQSGRWK